MITVTKTMRTETAHRLLNYAGRCAHLHGHSYKWEVTASSEELLNGMVVDFKDLKKAILRVIDPLDHAVILNADDPLLPTLIAQSSEGLDNPRVISVAFNPTAEELAQWVGYSLFGITCEGGIFIDQVKVWETETSCATWRSDNVRR